MTTLFIKQKVMSLGGEFRVFTEDQTPRYTVRGTFMQIPKRFTIHDADDVLIGEITKVTFSWTPRFVLQLPQMPPITIRKLFTFIKPRYAIDAGNLTVDGDWWDLNFSVLRDGVEIARIRRKMLSWADTYAIEILDDGAEHVIVSLVVAIDCVRADESAAAAAG